MPPNVKPKDEADDYDYACCPLCNDGGLPVLLGDLGHRRYYRCRACGVDFSGNEILHFPEVEQ
jgi:hypothetical protein